MTGTTRPSAIGSKRRQRHGCEAATAPRSHRDGRRPVPPKLRPGAYAPSSGAGPGRRAVRRPAPLAQPVRVLLPEEPPELTPAAAKALLRILLKAYADQEGALEMKDTQAACPGEVD